ncbi:MAG: SWIM zinc finger family protein [Planctomycetes bacterium]|nr:SWIM zinc finger family protein [Planctomycetota bacterium]
MAYGWAWRPYVPVARRRAQAFMQMEKLRKKGVNIQPVRIEGRQIARTFWGRSWCEHLEKFSDFENRLPRGRTYVRNGSVCHLDIQKGKIAAKVSGSEIYDIQVTIKALPKQKWRRVRESCAGQVGSLLELLQGRLSDHVMAVVTDKDRGLFPHPGEIGLDCSCPDWAEMCKHVAAVLYGVGARLDEKPELLFVLRGVDHTELVSADAAKAIVTKASKTDRRTLDESALSEVFGIDIAPTTPAKATAATTRSKTRGSTAPRQGRPARGAARRTVPPAIPKRIETKPARARQPAGKRT